MVNYIKAPLYKTLKSIPVNNALPFLNYVPNLAIWGSAAGLGVFVFAEGVPLIQTTFLQKIPYIGEYWIHNPDPEDVPV